MVGPGSDMGGSGIANFMWVITLSVDRLLPPNGEAAALASWVTALKATVERVIALALAQGHTGPANAAEDTTVMILVFCITRERDSARVRIPLCVNFLIFYAVNFI